MPRGPLPLALDDALWADPSPTEGTADTHAAAPLPTDLDVLTVPGDPLEAWLATAGRRAWLGIRADDPFAPGAPLEAAERLPVSAAAPRRWDAARDVASLLLGSASAGPEPDGEGADDEAADDGRADGGGADDEQAGALAAALAAAAEADEAVTLHLSDDARSAAVGLRTAQAFAVIAAGGAPEPLVARLLAESRTTGLKTFWTRTCDPDDPAAWLRRWSTAL